MNKKPVSVEWLRDKYEREGLDCVQIGNLVERDAKSVWNWLKAYGIPTRPRGSNAAANLLNGRRPGFTLTPEHKARLREARLADGHFPKQENGLPYWAGKRGNSHPSWRGGATPERQAFYASDEWKHARKIAYTRAGGRCERCRTRDHLHVHHVLPFLIKRTRALPLNLRILCKDCHRFVHSAANGDREFLPPFATIPITKGGVTTLVPISYRPKHKGQWAPWMMR